MADSAPSIEMVLTAWLSPLGRVGTRRKSVDPVPQRIIHRVTGVDDDMMQQDVAVVSVHTFAASDEAAVVESERTHVRMLDLASNPLTEVTLTGGLKVTIDYCKPVMKPVRVDFEDPNVVRYVGRYEVGHPYITQ